MNDKNIFNTILALGGSTLTYLFGYWDEPLRVLLILMILDYSTGVITGIIQNKLNSHTGFNGILRKSTILFVLIVAVLLDRLIGNGAWIFRTVVCYFYIGNEGISILENCGKCGVPLPKKILKTLEQLKEKEV